MNCNNFPNTNSLDYKFNRVSVIRLKITATLSRRKDYGKKQWKKIKFYLLSLLEKLRNLLVFILII